MRTRYARLQEMHQWHCLPRLLRHVLPQLKHQHLHSLHQHSHSLHLLHQFHHLRGLSQRVLPHSRQLLQLLHCSAWLLDLLQLFSLRDVHRHDLLPQLLRWPVCLLRLSLLFLRELQQFSLSAVQARLLPRQHWCLRDVFTQLFNLFRH